MVQDKSMTAHRIAPNYLSYQKVSQSKLQQKTLEWEWGVQSERFHAMTSVAQDWWIVTASVPLIHQTTPLFLKTEKNLNHDVATVAHHNVP